MQPDAFKDKSYKISGKLLGEIVPDSPLRGLPDPGTAVDSPLAMQELTTAYITTMYYSAFTNLYLQSFLPEDSAGLDERPRLKIAFARTYADYIAAANWLAQNGGAFIAASPAKRYYDEVLGMAKGSVVDIAALDPQHGK